MSLSTEAQLYPLCDSSSLVQHTCFTLCYNETTEQADWVYYYLTPERTQTKVISRTDNFRPDPLVKTGSAHPADYKKTGFDRGHLCPAGDMGFDSIAMSESFFMSNMCPQFPGFNRGIWKTLEENVREWALLFDTLFVVTGPLFYDTSYSVIGLNKVAVPDACYKVLLGKTDSAYEAIAFVIPNLDGLSDPFHYVMSVDKAEEVIGFDFFQSLDNETETIIEADDSGRGFRP